MEKEKRTEEAIQVFRKMLVEEFGIKSTEQFFSFEKVEPYYSISMPIGDVEKRAVLFQKLIEIGTLFSDAKDWSPSEIVRHYRDKGLIRGNYLRIAWRNKQDLNITTE